MTDFFFIENGAVSYTLKVNSLKSCQISIEYEGTNIKSIKEDKCPKGKDYIKNEITNPVRIFTRSVLVKKGDFSLVSVKTPVPITKKYLNKMGEITHQIKIEAPIKIGQIIAKNLFGKKIDLITTGKININN